MMMEGRGKKGPGQERKGEQDKRAGISYWGERFSKEAQMARRINENMWMLGAA